jgi:hypothetical protein
MWISRITLSIIVFLFAWLMLNAGLTFVHANAAPACNGDPLACVAMAEAAR